MSSEYSVEPKSREELRTLAKIVRENLQIDNMLYVPIVSLLDVLSKLFEKFSYEIIEDSEFPTFIHADTNPITGHIRIKQSVYDGACEGVGRDRMTIAHEICHYFTLCLCGFQYRRSFSKKIKTFEDPEWQAKCMAGELMIDKELVRGMSPSEIAEKCGVSFSAAEYQYIVFQKEDNMK